MSETGSSCQSECSVYSLSTNNNIQLSVNGQQMFSQIDPESQTPHKIENNIAASGRSGPECCNHHDPVRQSVNNNPSDGFRTNHQPSEIFAGVNRNRELRMPCNCKVHIHYNLYVTPTTKCVGGHYGQYNLRMSNHKCNQQLQEIG